MLMHACRVDSVFCLCSDVCVNIESAKCQIQNGSRLCSEVWAWFRGYASTLNSANASLHRFLVLVYCKKHNSMMTKGDTDHLPPAPVGMQHRKKGGHYHCTPVAMKGRAPVRKSKAMKQDNAMKTKGASKAIKTGTSMKVIKGRKSMKVKMAKGMKKLR
jgi:hypothetical protein